MAETGFRDVAMPCSPDGVTKGHRPLQESLARALAAGHGLAAGLAPPRAKDVSVEKIFRARCHLPGCEAWRGGEYPDFQGANADRQAHLTWHVLGSAQ